MIDALKKEVNRIREKDYPDERKEDLQFDVGYLIKPSDGNAKDTDKIILTVNHHNLKLSRVIFPKTSHFEYMSLKEEMQYLFNATM